MALDPKVQAIIEILLKDRGTRQAILAMEKSGKAAKGMGDQLGRTEGAASKLTSTLLRFVGLTALFQFVKSSILAFAGLERQFNAVKIQMEGLGISAGRELPRVRAFLQALESAGDGLMTQTAPAFQTFLGLTKDTDAAMTATKLATGIAESGLMDLGGAVGVVSGLLSGKAVRSLKDLGVNLQESEDGTVDAAKAMEILLARFLTLGDQLDDTRDALDRSESAWEQVKRAVGESAAVLAGPFATATENGLNLFRSLGPIVLAVFKKVEGYLWGLNGVIKLALDPESWGEGFGERMAKVWKDGTAKTAPEVEAAMEELSAIYKKGGEKAAVNFTEGSKKILDVAGQRGRVDAAKAAAKSAEEVAKIVFEAKKSQLETELDMVRSTAAQEAELRGSATKETLARQMALEIEFLRLARDHALEEAKGRKEAELAIVDHYALAEAALVRKYDDELAQSAWDTAIKRLEASEAEKKAQIKNAKETAEAKAAIAKREAELERDIRIQIARESIATLTILFGQNKAFAIADAIINTYEGMTAALQMGPLGIPLAAVIAAKGFAAVRQIIQTEPGTTSVGGGGGGGGGSIRLGARGGGGRGGGVPAITPNIPNVGRGRGDSGGRSSVTNDNRQSVTNNNTTSGDTIDMRGATVLSERKLARIVRRAQRRDRAKFYR